MQAIVVQTNGSPSSLESVYQIFRATALSHRHRHGPVTVSRLLNARAACLRAVSVGSRKPRRCYRCGEEAAELKTRARSIERDLTDVERALPDAASPLWGALQSNRTGKSGALGPPAAGDLKVRCGPPMARVSMFAREEPSARLRPTPPILAIV